MNAGAKTGAAPVTTALGRDGPRPPCGLKRRARPVTRPTNVTAREARKTVTPLATVKPGEPSSTKAVLRLQARRKPSRLELPTTGLVLTTPVHAPHPRPDASVPAPAVAPSVTAGRTVPRPSPPFLRPAPATVAQVTPGQAETPRSGFTRQVLA